MSDPPHHSESTGRLRPNSTGPLLIACAGSLLVIGTLAPEIGGPGMTCDEPYHVAYGKRLVMAFRQQRLRFFKPGNIRENFDWRPGGPPVHPPLGNWILGLTHHLLDAAPDNLQSVSIVSARFAPALAFGLLIFLVGRYTTRTEGPVAGTVASAAVLLVPRLFGHAHLAALDMFTALSFTAAAIAVAEANARGGRLRDYAIAGVVWGLAMLTRLHGLLLLLPVALWLVWRLRLRAAVPLAVWLISGAVTLFAGWPWLWIDPIRHVRQFLGTATDRIPIHVFYAGQVWADHEVPRHYAVATFAATLPLGLLICGFLGLWARRRVRGSPPGFYLLLGSLAFMLLVFSWPGVPVYDGERLFLMVFPLWAVAAGVGANWLIEHRVWAARSRGLRKGVIAGFVAIQGVGVVMYHPCYLSHYSLLVGGLPGAARLGFEVNYWGDAVTERLLAEVAEKAPNGVIIYGPNLAPYQAPMLAVSSPALSAKRVMAVGWDPSHPRLIAGCRYGVFYHRRADLDGIPSELLNGEVLGENSILGAWTARVIEFSSPIGQGGWREASVRPTRGDLATRRPPRPPLRSG